MKRSLQILAMTVSFIALYSCKNDITFRVFKFDDSKTTATNITENSVTLNCKVIQTEKGNYGIHNKDRYCLYMVITDYPEYFKGENKSSGWKAYYCLTTTVQDGTYFANFEGLKPNTTYYYAPIVPESSYYDDYDFEHRSIGESIIQGEVKSFTTSYLISSITYTATEKLPEAEDGVVGLHTNAFNVAIISHEFSNGTGTISFAGEVTTIGYAAFADCYDLTTITIPNSVTTIGEYAFTWCKGLTSVTIGNSVTTIGKDAFYYCPKLTSITIPKSVTTIEEYAFGSCESLFDVYVSWTQKSQLPTLGEMVFAFCPQNATLHIPTGTKNIYENVDQWKDFGKIKDDVH